VTKSPVNSTWIEKITVLSTILESLLNFLFNNLKKHYKSGKVREKNNVKIS